MFTGADKNNTSPGPTTQPFNAYRYNAMRWDSSSGQYDMGFRNYDPSLNQFLSRDMYNGALADIRLDTDPFTGNRYTFGAGNPVSNIEFTGHDFIGGCSNTTPGCPGSMWGGGGSQGSIWSKDQCTNDPPVSLVKCSPQPIPNLRPDIGFCLHLASTSYATYNAAGCDVDFGEVQKQIDAIGNPLRKLLDGFGIPQALESAVTAKAAEGAAAASEFNTAERIAAGSISGCVTSATGGIFQGLSGEQIAKDCAVGAVTGAFAAAPPGVGKTAAGTVAGVAAGATAGAAANAGTQAVANNGFNNINWGQVGVNGVLGGLFAGLGGFASATGVADLVVADVTTVVGTAASWVCSHTPGWC